MAHACRYVDTCNQVEHVFVAETDVQRKEQVIDESPAYPLSANQRRDLCITQ
jgi:pyruvate carboxylase